MNEMFRNCKTNASEGAPPRILSATLEFNPCFVEDSVASVKHKSQCPRIRDQSDPERTTHIVRHAREDLPI